MAVCIQLVLRDICCNDSFNDIVFKHCVCVLLNTIVAPLKNCHLEIALCLSSKNALDNTSTLVIQNTPH